MKLHFLLAALLAANSFSASAQQVKEKLNRAPVAVKTSQGILVSWRSLTSDAKNLAFDVYRNGKKVASAVSDVTGYLDANGKPGDTYRIVSSAGETSEAIAWNSMFTTFDVKRPASIKSGNTTGRYRPDDMAVGDLDGDGNYELILKWMPDNQRDNGKDGYASPVIISAYRMDGTPLWEKNINLGLNVRSGNHTTQMVVYDFDGDGKAELICKTANGSTDGKGRFVTEAGDANIQAVDNAKTYLNSKGRVTGGEEFLTIFNGETGEAMHTIWYSPSRSGEDFPSSATANSSFFGDSNCNRSERFNACAAYLDGMDKLPSAVFQRGYYKNCFLWAVDWNGKELSTRWLHKGLSNKWEVVDAKGQVLSSGTGNSSFGQGVHGISVGDVNNDGFDDICIGAATIGHDGKLLCATGKGHGDAQHLADLDPDRPGLEYYMVHEEYPYGSDLRDARTGEILFRTLDKDDTGRGLAADIDAQHRGYELWCSDAPVVRDIKGKPISVESSLSSQKNHEADHFRSNEKTTFRAVSRMPAMNFRIYWDGDLQDELLANGRPPHFPPYLQKWNGKEAVALPLSNGKQLYEMGNSVSCNWSKATPNLQADLFGDWREEVIYWDKSDASHLNIFTTNIPTDYRVPTLMHDHIYRMGVAWQNVGYNQPPHLGYYLPDHAEKIQK